MYGLGEIILDWERLIWEAQPESISHGFAENNRFHRLYWLCPLRNLIWTLSAYFLQHGRGRGIKSVIRCKRNSIMKDEGMTQRTGQQVEVEAVIWGNYIFWFCLDVAQIDLKVGWSRMSQSRSVFSCSFSGAKKNISFIGLQGGKKEKTSNEVQVAQISALFCLHKHKWVLLSPKPTRLHYVDCTRQASR